MRIAVVGGIARSLVSFRGELLGTLAANGHNVLALAPEDDASVRATLAAMDVDYATVPLRRTSLNPVWDIAAVVALARIFRERHTDAVLVYAAKPVVYGLIAARIAGVPMRAAMITGAGSALGGGAGLRRRILAALMRNLYSLALRQAHVVFFQNPDDERRFRSIGLVGPRARVVRINGSGVDLAYFSPQPLPPPPMTFLMIGRLILDKGLSEYVEAARLVRRLHPEVRVQLIGPLDSNPSAITPRDLDTWRREGAIEYLGTTSDVRPYLAGAHVYVLPSYGEGMPRSTLEAMATGRAVLTTDVPGCRETVVAARNGLLVPARDPVALAEGMLTMIAQPNRLEQMGRESRAIAEELFDVHTVNRAILAAMELT